jgi:hypothetical protein
MRKRTFLWLFLTAMLFGSVSANAQVTIGSGNMPMKNALLDLDASTVKKGLAMPRLTEAERDALVSEDSADADKEANKGLTIFNTEVNCVEMWDGEAWANFCGGPTGSMIDIGPEACNSIRVYGNYFRNAPLVEEQHYIVLPLTVTKKGGYSIVVTSMNGYYYEASGSFELPGYYELRLPGKGTPIEAREDILNITNNGMTIGATCEPKVDVKAMTMSYRVDCDSTEVFGEYECKSFMNTDNYAEVIVDVQQLGTTNISTDMVNGVRFVGNYEFTTYGPQTLKLMAQGSPIQEGDFRYSFTTDGAIKTTCSFIVSSFSTLGTFDNPACNCLAMAEERPFVANGEYWLANCKAGADVELTPVRVFCDVAGGGWTMVWSFSEKTAYEDMPQSTTSGGTGFDNTMVVDGAYWGVDADRPLNRVTAQPTGEDSPTDLLLDYTNFRLSKAEWTGLPASDRSEVKVRIAENPADMNDEWGMNNYGIIHPRTLTDNPIYTRFGSRPNIPTDGKVFGKRWEVRTSGSGYGGWDEVTNAARTILMYNSTSYCTHWDWSNDGSATPFEVVPNRGGADNTIAMNNFNNMFGWFGETQVNHHFGKCGGAAGDEFSFATKYCAYGNLYPHTSINGGEGRYLQWFVR